MRMNVACTRATLTEAMQRLARAVQCLKQRSGHRM
jgi:bifunctional pyridoxal-dependent enzyme with beta-cystathionase and maltose regulon repressor activities